MLKAVQQTAHFHEMNINPNDEFKFKMKCMMIPCNKLSNEMKLYLGFQSNILFSLSSFFGCVFVLLLLFSGIKWSQCEQISHFIWFNKNRPEWWIFDAMISFFLFPTSNLFKKHLAHQQTSSEYNLDWDYIEIYLHMELRANEITRVRSNTRINKRRERQKEREKIHSK